jgi:hypothetical protein
VISIASFALAIHFGSVFVYSKPIASQKQKIDFYAQAYVYPYFHQNWNLFVPIPNANYKLFCEFENNGKQTVDIFEEITIKHQSNRLTGYEPLIVAFSNSFHFFESSTKLHESLNGPISADLNFSMIEHATKNYLEYTRKIKIQKVKLMLVAQQCFTNEQKIYFN